MLKYLFYKVDNSPLIVFRIVFGLVLTAEAWGSIFTGWIKDVFIDPELNFPFIAFSWLQPLPGNGMYFLYGIMGLLGLFVLLGNFYRLSIIAYTVLWSYTYVLHKAAYNNHYYLMVLLCTIMCFLPANTYASLDVKYGRVKKETSMFYWGKFLLMFQITCVYLFGAIAKIYPDWMDGTFTQLLLNSKKTFPFIGQYFVKPWFYMGIAYGGFLFDLLIIPLLCYKKTRRFGFLISIFFHSFNSIVFQVGVFPYLSISFALFFFSDKYIQNLFLPKKEYYSVSNKSIINKKVVVVLGAYMLLQLALPLRHHFIDGNVFWTEEGHKMSWRMMLRAKSGKTYYKVVNTVTKEEKKVYPTNLSKKQKNLISTHPDVIWQYAQHIKEQEAANGNTVQVFAVSKMSLNQRPYQVLIDPNVDLSATKWNYFKHSPWITSFNGWD